MSKIKLAALAGLATVASLVWSTPPASSQLRAEEASPHQMVPRIDSARTRISHTSPRRRLVRSKVAPRVNSVRTRISHTSLRRSLVRSKTHNQVARAKHASAIKLKEKHRLAIQVNVNDPAAMNLALNNVTNVTEYYRARREPVQVEIVAYGPGLHMLREDTSPVKDRIRSMSEAMPNVAFKACGNTRQNMQKTEAKEIPLISQAQVIESGVVRLMALQEAGWSYIRP